MTKKELKKEVKFYKELVEDTARELVEACESKDKIIKMFESQISVMEKAIERKDRQFFGLKEAYKDDLINGGV